jgi:hypothetical protein
MRCTMNVIRRRIRCHVFLLAVGWVCDNKVVMPSILVPTTFVARYRSWRCLGSVWRPRHHRFCMLMVLLRAHVSTSPMRRVRKFQIVP